MGLATQAHELDRKKELKERPTDGETPFTTLGL